MTKQVINVGGAANDGTGDPVRTALTKTNQNFSDLYTALGAPASGVLPQAMPVANGGTGSKNSAEARVNLGVDKVLQSPNGTRYYSGSNGDYLSIWDTNRMDYWSQALAKNVVSINCDAGIFYNQLQAHSTGSYATTTSSAANLNIASNGTISRSTSSMKYKTDAEAIQDAYADALIYGAKPIYYRSLCEGDNPDWAYWGLSAEQIAQIDPRICHWKTQKSVEIEVEVKDHDEAGNEITRTEKRIQYHQLQVNEMEVEGVMYDRFVPHLINVIQRLTKRIETLEAHHHSDEKV